MKSEREIRAHRDDLLAAARGPCRHQHPTREEQAQCDAGALQMAAAAAALSWALGEPGDYDRVVERIAAGVRR